MNNLSETVGQVQSEPEVNEPSRFASVREIARSGTRTFSVVEADRLVSRTTKVGLKLDDVIGAELKDYAAGQAAGLESGAVADEIEYANRNGDLAFWDGNRCLAIMRADPNGGDPIVFDLELKGKFTPCYKGRERYRSFTVFIANPEWLKKDDPDKFAGYGMTLEKVVEWEDGVISDTVKTYEEDGEDVEAYIKDCPDLIVTERDAVVAILQPTMSGRHRVVMIDREGGAN